MVTCNICNWKGEKFIDIDCGYGHIYKNSTCPNCHSQPRFRYFHMYLKKILDDNKKELNVLHFAPNKSITNLFKSYSFVNYLSVDIDPKKAMKKEDITNLSFEDNSFDIIFCSHVLEHVKDDNKAMREMLRVLKKDGFAIIDVPIDYNKEKTFEDFSIITPEERTKAFWQHDHIRLYGKDFPNKLKKSEFQVKEDDFIKSLGSEIINEYGLKIIPIYFCTK